MTDGLPGYAPSELTDTQLALSNGAGCPFLWLAALGVEPLVTGLVRHSGPLRSGRRRAAGLLRKPGDGWSAMWWQKAVAVTVVGVSLLAYPVVILLQESRVQAGNAVQPRYILPMMLMLVGLSLLRRRGRLAAQPLPGRGPGGWPRARPVPGAVLEPGPLRERRLDGPADLDGRRLVVERAAGVAALALDRGQFAFAAVAVVVLGHGVERGPRPLGRSRPAIATTARRGEQQEEQQSTRRGAQPFIAADG